MTIAPASRILRFLNFIIDLFIYTILVSFLLFSIQKFTGYLITPTSKRFLSLVFYFLYYLVFELLIKTTPGKIITKTKIITDNEEIPSSKIIIDRSLLRLIPFEPISILFNTKKLSWHDRFSKTRIVHIIN
ncbi:RDD family protein [Sunxiuqinia sp. A32]|uniref:RDD family protein n=1 Tax=Sunxiuqinia sp. A32 TaxID=3461496 RepID=UPI0040452182